MNILVILSIIYNNHVSLTISEARKLNSYIVERFFFSYASSEFHVLPWSGDIESLVDWQVSIQGGQFD